MAKVINRPRAQSRSENKQKPDQGSVPDTAGLLTAEEAADGDYQLQVSLPDTDLSATVGAFTTRIERKKREQEKVNGVLEQETRVRQGILLEALMNIRRSLAEVIRIDLGERFFLTLDVDDWEGWPRLVVQLNDSILPDVEYPQFQVNAHDRNSRGIIEIIYGEQTKPARISMSDESDVQRLPTMLKKCVRAFLDRTGEIVLKAEHHEDPTEEEKQLQRKQIPGFDTVEPAADYPAISGDLFDDDFAQIDILERLPSLGQLDALPDVAPESSKTRRRSQTAATEELYPEPPVSVQGK